MEQEQFNMTEMTYVFHHGRIHAGVYGLALQLPLNILFAALPRVAVPPRPAGGRCVARHLAIHILRPRGGSPLHTWDGVSVPVGEA